MAGPSEMAGMAAARPARPLVIRGGTVVDGSGSAPSKADVLVDGGSIAAVGPGLDAPDSAVEIDASGRHVLPGFVDVHSHDDVAAVKPGLLDPKLRQGVTLTVVGNCGHGCAPIGPDANLAAYSAPILGAFPADRAWQSFPEYLHTLGSENRTTHVAALAPHGPLRAATVGVGRRPATAPEIDQLCGLLDDALSAGAAGLSLGLMYPPGNAADGAELAALAQLVARHDKLLVAHVRNEGDRILDSLAEFVELGRMSGCAVHVSHLKVTSPANHGRMAEVVDTLERYRSEGIDVTADVYPYEAGSTTAATLFPPWTADDGLDSLLGALADPSARGRVAADLRQPWDMLENYFLTLGPEGIRLLGFSLPDHKRFEGRSLAEIAGVLGRSPADCLADLVLAERGGLSVVLFQMTDADIREALAWPWTTIGSDGLPIDHGSVHPRLYGTFPRVLARYADSVPGLPFVEAVRRMTSYPHRRFGLRDKGLVAPGQDADLVVVDCATLRDTATYDDPRQFPEGIDAVVVGGRLAWQVSGGPIARHGRLVRAGNAGRT